MSGIPSGTVVFFFTDMVGSTHLWERHPAEMKADLSRHDAILRAAIESNGGYVFKTVGDAFCAAFPTGSQAVLAAVELAKDALPRGATLLSLGSYRLKDLSQPQQVFQLLHPDLPRSFPALVTLDSRPNNLEPQPTPLIGREGELAAIMEMVRRREVSQFLPA